MSAPAFRPTDVTPEPDIRRNLPRWVRVSFAGNLICQIGIVVTGGVVRLTDSGLGCDTWPQCTPGSFTPSITQQAGIHPFIEFGNRTLTGVLSVFALLIILAVASAMPDRSGRTRYPDRGAFRLLFTLKGLGFKKLAYSVLALTLLQAVIGGGLVLLDLHPNMLIPHFLISIGLIAISTLLWERLDRPDGPAVPRYHRAVTVLYGVLCAVGVVVLVLGTMVTGSGPHSGDAHMSERLPFDPRTISWLHADSVMVFIGLLVGFVIAVYLVGATRRTLNAAWTLVGVTALQGAIGYTQYFLGLPEVMVALHMLGAGLFAWALTRLGAGLFRREAGEAEKAAGLVPTA